MIMEPENGIETLPIGGDRRKAPETVTVRPMSFAEGIALSAGDHCRFKAKDGTVRTVKINGKVHRWKREPMRVEIPVKYGLYECGTFHWYPASQRFEPHGVFGVYLLTKEGE